MRPQQTANSLQHPVLTLHLSADRATINSVKAKLMKTCDAFTDSYAAALINDRQNIHTLIKIL